MASKNFPLSILIGLVDKVSSPIKKVSKTVEEAGKGLQDFRDRMGEISENTGLTATAQAFGSMAKQAAAFAAVAGAGAFAITKGFADAAKAVNNASARFGISARTLQEWNYVASRAGMTADDLQQALTEFSVNLGEAKLGEGEAAKIFQALRINTRDANGRLRDMASILPELADKLRSVKDAQLRAAATAKLFGEDDGAKMAAFLRLGSAGIAELSREAHALGIVMSDDALAGAKAFSESMIKLQTVLEGVRNTLGASLAPAFAALASRFSDFILRNREQIAAFAQMLADRLPGALMAVADGAQDVFNAFAPLMSAVSWLFETLGSGNAVLLLLAARFALLLNPVGLCIAALVAGYVAGRKLGEYLRKNYPEILDAVGAAIAGVVNWFKDAADRVDRLVQAFKSGNIGAIVKEWFGLVTKFNPFSILLESAQALSRFVTDKLPDWAKQKLGIEVAPGPAFGASDFYGETAGRIQRNKVDVNVNFGNVPRGTQTSVNADKGVGVTLDQGYSMAVP